MTNQAIVQRLNDRVYQQRLALKHERAEGEALEARMRKTVHELAHAEWELGQATPAKRQ